METNGIESNGNVSDDIFQRPTILIWDKKIPDTQLEKFKKYISEKYNQHFESYWDLHKWSVENFMDYWKEMWDYFDIIASKPYDEVFAKTGKNFLDVKWFPGARFNFAENLLRYRHDAPALICLDELGNEEILTFAELYEEVKLYAAAFRKHGLKIGDRVACFMSNRKEPVIVALAVFSIGGIFGGPSPFFGAKAASKVLNFMEPKFILTVDHFQEDGQPFHVIDDFPTLIENIPSMEKLIVVTTKKETEKRLMNMPKCISLNDFLRAGVDSNGIVPNLVFEQLPLDHPRVINFTSGTTGLPKGVVHGIGSLIGELRDFIFILDLKKGDRLFSHYPVGWSVWDYPLPSLSLGITVFLYAGCPTYTRLGFNLWNIFSKYKITYSFIATPYIDHLDKKNIVPDPGMNFDHFKVLSMGASPVKPKNYEYIYDKVKKDVFLGTLYGATETFGDVTAFDYNSPSYMNECQVPALGVDFHCFDKVGNSVIGKRGEIVIGKPTPSLPMYLWKDKNNERLMASYFNKYDGKVWCQNDEGWINPKTKGIIIIGRSDDAIKQEGERFSSDDIYFAIHQMEELDDYICVGQTNLKGDQRAILFVKMKNGYSLTEDIKEKIRLTIAKELSQYHTPTIIEVPDIPINLNSKRLESVVRKIVATNAVPEVANIKNPKCLQYFCNIPEVVAFIR
ncbi:acetoacetyl-CoA synthetase-like isoform X2 [Argiope bruennichi]|uniref:acetoacetyl-CoA synthetase-like isoform X2 n=1 Tax=Argiope bruennichi TaxID=94029 RepID=UPI002494E752|nr:acetoacetyl-CoA synthetase-like isoform X2 [Argiope bruennichi]